MELYEYACNNYDCSISFYADEKINNPKCPNCSTEDVSGRRKKTVNETERS